MDQVTNLECILNPSQGFDGLSIFLISLSQLNSQFLLKKCTSSIENSA
jgi:hypothetical protein